jgi:signal transduction histidine kinase
MRYDGARFLPLAVASGPLRGVTGIVETADGDLWLNGIGGVRHVRAAEIQSAMRDPRYVASDERFDFHDGLPGEPPQLRPLPSAIQGTDGRLWFLTTSSVAWLDPAHIRRNPIPPPVEIRALAAGGRQYRPLGRVDLPPRTTALQIGYTALSLGVPDRVQFRYRLIGSDTTWVEAGRRREAFYTNLGPGSYRFQVIAANEDGVWNEVGAAFELAIPPTVTQSRWFLAVWMAALGGLVWLVYLARVRQIAGGLRARYQAALVERTRIAQDLHDTLLQGFTGITLQLRAIQRVLAQRPQESAEALKGVLASADTALRDARHMIWDMRAVELEGQDLADALEHAARTMTGSATELVLTVTGHRRGLPLAVETTALRIGREAVLNAVKHAAPGRVKVDLEYWPRVLTLRVSDDGTGIAQEAMEAAARGEHWGLAGMRDRAQRAGGTLEISSEPGRGTVVSVSLPIGEKIVASTGSNS